MILLCVVLTVFKTGGLHATKLMGIHAAKSLSGSHRNPQMDILELNFKKTKICKKQTKCISVLVWSKKIQQHIHVKPLSWPFKGWS